MAIHNRLKILLAQKEVRDKRKYSYDDIYTLTGISPRTIGKYMNNEATRFDGETLETLCNWLECNLSDLLVYPIPPEVGQQSFLPQAIPVS